ncbi:MAG: hypothetical protein IPI67_04005 [Myxococcales bacterium]|nr:hypothetical protein [Myxococcales bacterium]
MPVTRARVTAWVVGAALAAGALAVFKRPASPERESMSLVERIAATLDDKPSEAPAKRAARLRQELAPLLSPDASFDVSGGPSARGRDEVIARAIELGFGHRPAIQLKELRAQSLDPSRVRITFEALVSDSQAGDLHAAPRHGEVEVEHGSGGYLLRRLTLDAESRAEPEPRP